MRIFNLIKLNKTCLVGLIKFFLKKKYEKKNNKLFLCVSLILFYFIFKYINFNNIYFIK